MTNGTKALNSIREDYFIENNQKTIILDQKDKRFEIIAEELIAFEIVVKKDVDIFYFKNVKTAEEYNKDILIKVFPNKKLSDAQFNLLKRVIKNELK